MLDCLLSWWSRWPSREPVPRLWFHVKMEGGPLLLLWTEREVKGQGQSRLLKTTLVGRPCRIASVVFGTAGFSALNALTNQISHNSPPPASSSQLCSDACLSSSLVEPGAHMFDPAARPGSVCRRDQRLKIEGVGSHVRRVPRGLAQIRRKEATRDGWWDEFVAPPHPRRALAVTGLVFVAFFGLLGWKIQALCPNVEIRRDEQDKADKAGSVSREHTHAAHRLHVSFHSGNFLF